MARRKSESRKPERTALRLTQMGVLIALIAVAAWFPVKIVVEITLCFLPVLFGAVLLGPSAGAFLGLVWGLCSFAQCFGWFSPSALGAAILTVNPWWTAVLCIVPRVLVGFLVAWLYKAVKKMGGAEWIACGLTGLFSALLNTVFFVGGLMLFFGNADYILSFRQGFASLWGFLVGCFGINCLLEAVVGLVTGMAFANIVPLLRRRK